MTRSANTRQLQADSFFKTRIDSDRCTSGKLFGLLLAFIGSVCICAIIGSPSSAPPVFKTSGRSETMACTQWDCSPTFHGYLNRLTKLHQVFYLEFFLEHPYEYGRMEEDYKRALNFQLVFDVEAEGEMVEDGPRTKVYEKKAVTRTINCPASKDCDKTTIFAENFLEFTGYYVRVTYKHPYISSGLVAEDGQSFDGQYRTHAEMGELAAATDHHEFLPHALKGRFMMKYVNEKFTEFEFGVKYFALVITLIVAATYIHGLRSSLEDKYWSYEQRWVMGLVIMLIGFDDPFYVIEIYTPALFWTGLNVMLQCTFLVCLLFFWLSVFHIISSDAFWQERYQPRGFCFYFPKAVLCLLIWLFTITLFMFVRMQTEADPTFYAMDDFDHFTFSKGMAEGLVTIYFLWAFMYAAKCIFKATKNRGTSKPQFVFLFGITCIVVVMALIGLSLGAFAPEVIYAIEFTTFFGACNCYIWFMCYAYYPASDLGDGHDFNGNDIATDVEMTGVPGLALSGAAGGFEGGSDNYGRQIDDEDDPKYDENRSIGV